MSITATVRNYIRFTGDQDSEQIFNSGFLDESPAISDLVSLAIGNNEISVPVVDDLTVHGVAIVPPTGNDEGITLKGAAGDIGIPISANQPTILQFGATPPANIYVSVAAEVEGLRLIWF